MNLYLFTLARDPFLFCTATLLIVFSICCHEFMHAFVALKFGDSTAADAGHLTLNPLRQMGWFSLLMLAILGIAWGQVPVNPAKMRGKYAPFFVAAAGPATNLLLALLFSFFSVLCLRLTGNLFCSFTLSYAATLNIVLAVLNFLPIPGLDGFQMLRTFWHTPLSTLPELVNGVLLILMMLFLFFIDKIYVWASTLTGVLIRCFLFLLGGRFK